MKGDTLATLKVLKGESISAAKHNRTLDRLADLTGETASGRRPFYIELPFTLFATDLLKVKVRAGRISINDTIIDVAESSEISIPSGSTSFKVWLSLDSEFSPTTGTINSGASGWTGYPAQPSPPSVKHFLLAEIASSSTAITTITQRWHGGDIILPSVFAFWA